MCCLLTAGAWSSSRLLEGFDSMSLFPPQVSLTALSLPAFPNVLKSLHPEPPFPRSPGRWLGPSRSFITKCLGRRLHTHSLVYPLAPPSLAQTPRQVQRRRRLCVRLTGWSVGHGLLSSALLAPATLHPPGSSLGFLLVPPSPSLLFLFAAPLPPLRRVLSS